MPNAATASSPQVSPTTGDIQLTSAGDAFLFVSGVDYIAQLVRSRLGLYQGEYFPDVTQGMPWFQSILIKGYNPNVVQNVFKNMIAGTTGVLSVTALSLSFDNDQRSLNISFAAQSIVGEVTDQFLLPITPQPQGP